MIEWIWNINVRKITLKKLLIQCCFENIYGNNMLFWPLLTSWSSSLTPFRSFLISSMHPPPKKKPHNNNTYSAPFLSRNNDSPLKLYKIKNQFQIMSDVWGYDGVWHFGPYPQQDTVVCILLVGCRSDYQF